MLTNFNNIWHTVYKVNLKDNNYWLICLTYYCYTTQGRLVWCLQLPAS